MSLLTSSADVRPEASVPSALTGSHHDLLLPIASPGIRSPGEDEREPFLNEPNRTQPGFVAKIIEHVTDRWLQTRQFITSDEGIGVLKCGLAYLLGSLATFIPVVAALLGPQEGKHIVATITVYFHPARSKGSMYKALICAALAFIYAAFVSLTSMYVTIYFHQRRMIELGHALVLIIFVGLGFGFIAWTKQKMSDPLVNVACSLASLALIVVLTKEGAIQRGSVSLAKVSQVLKMLLMGIGATMTVSFLVFPVSAQKKLRSNLAVATRSMAIIQSTITEGFLRRTQHDLQGFDYTGASTRLKKAHGELHKLLYETKLEQYVAGWERAYCHEEKLVHWAHGIVHTTGALHSSALLALETLKRPKFADHPLDGPNANASTATSNDRQSTTSSGDDPILQPVDIGMLEMTALDNGQPVAAQLGRVSDGLAPESLLVTELFDSFVDRLGPSMRSFTLTLINISAEIPLGLSLDNRVAMSHGSAAILTQAIEEYREAQREAFGLLYREKLDNSTGTFEQEAYFKEVAAICAHFSHSLLKFGEQLGELLTILADFEVTTAGYHRKKSWSWIKFWRRDPPRSRYMNHPNDGLDPRPSLTEVAPGYHTELLGTSSFERPSRLQPFRDRICRHIRGASSFFRKDETIFAFKVGVGAALFALPSFLSFTRPIYLYWKGEWGLVSYMLVCSMTIGASNTTGYARFLGTCIGALCSILVWSIAGSNAFGLAVLGFVMAICTFYISLLKGQGPLGRFIMLTYNLSVLYSFSLSQSSADEDPDERSGSNPDITQITLHRVAAVLSGCIWGIIVTRGVWPISARKKLRTTLKLVWLRLGRIWETDPLARRITNPGVAALYMTPEDRLKMQSLLSELETLRVAARYEIELNAPFPDTAYGKIIQHTQSIVDDLHALDLQLLGMPPSEPQLSLLRYTSRERQNLSGQISHLLGAIASSITHACPPNQVDLSKAKHSRDRLLATIFLYRSGDETSSSALDETYSLLYAYILVIDQIIGKMAEILADVGRLSTGRGRGERVVNYE
ncbi:Fusaric acid resistance protein-like-domain-containing protein [Aspergillus caelatus]|uniref:Fusaric acid resistance protein-like-domain-containing protein n=1 Tax=Aspergillus caelatus TaxID=61420 RepID=A0A5N7A9P8_9EURO|nr:Fusaric acid resistance protein-like-domain-containing protein [Aspergillus caelatus]KAE8366597.1 Fusaric acid resistance protein-like-domain-containing protein [Aspergillus caelatus]